MSAVLGGGFFQDTVATSHTIASAGNYVITKAVIDFQIQTVTAVGGFAFFSLSSTSISPIFNGICIPASGGGAAQYEKNAGLAGPYILDFWDGLIIPRGDAITFASSGWVSTSALQYLVWVYGHSLS